MKKLFAILILVLCVVAFSDFDASARPRGPRGPRGPRARTAKVIKKKGNRRCPSCRGAGEIFIWSSPDGILKGCTRCGGSGMAYTNRMGEIEENHGLRKGRGRI